LVPADPGHRRPPPGHHHQLRSRTEGHRPPGGRLMPRPATSRRSPTLAVLPVLAVMAVLALLASCSSDDEGGDAGDGGGTTSTAAGSSTTAPDGGNDGGDDSAAPLVFNGQGNHLDVYEGEPPFTSQRLITSAADDPSDGLDINAQICFWEDDGTTYFITGED